MSNANTRKSGDEKESSISENIEEYVSYDEVHKVAQSISLKEYKPFKFDDLEHQLIFCENDTGKPVEFHKSTQLSGCDIYIWQSLINKTEDYLLRAVIAHELTEIAAYEHLYEKTNWNRQKISETSHAVALLHEKKFVDDTLDDIRRKEYEIFAESLRQQDWE